MKQKDAKKEILQLWLKRKEPWKKGDHQAFFRSARFFYFWLEQHHPQLLAFRSKAEKWKAVQGWVNAFEKYPDC